MAYIGVVVIEVVVTDVFREWYEALISDEQESIFRVVSLLERLGVALGFPYSSAIEGSSHSLRELRIQHRGRPFRVFYAFDPRRQAVLLIGGDKTGNERFYTEMIPRAVALLDAYLKENGWKESTEKGGNDQ